MASHCYGIKLVEYPSFVCSPTQCSPAAANVARRQQAPRCSCNAQFRRVIACLLLLPGGRVPGESSSQSVGRFAHETANDASSRRLLLVPPLVAAALVAATLLAPHQSCTPV
jgi:hypothetical protein